MKWLVVFGLVCVFYGSAQSQDVENLLVNPDFEEGAVGWEKEEHAENGAVVQLIVDDKEFVTGAHSMQIDIQVLDGSGTWWHAGLNQSVALKGGETYTLALFAKTESTKIRFSHLSGGENHAPWANWGEKDIQITDEWLEYFTTWQQVVNDANARIRIAVGQSKWNVWVDHVRLYIGEYVPAVLEEETRPVDAQGKLTVTWGQLKRR